ncbi:MAG: membrane protein insertion efficiency factor YidD [Desulfobacterales bacterium]
MKKIFNLIMFFTVLGALGTNALAGQGMRPDHLKIANDGKEKKSDALLLPIRFYRDYISRVDGDRCPSYPTCSQYCSEAIKKHGAFLGWIMCSDRLIRDGRDETRLSDPVWVDGKRRTYDPVSNNDFWWH